MCMLIILKLSRSKPACFTRIMPMDAHCADDALFNAGKPLADAAMSQNIALTSKWWQHHSEKRTTNLKNKCIKQKYLLVYPLKPKLTSSRTRSTPPIHLCDEKPRHLGHYASPVKKFWLRHFMRKRSKILSKINENVAESSIRYVKLTSLRTYADNRFRICIRNYMQFLFSGNNTKKMANQL